MISESERYMETCYIVDQAEGDVDLQILNSAQKELELFNSVTMVAKDIYIYIFSCYLQRLAKVSKISSSADPKKSVNHISRIRNESDGVSGYGGNKFIISSMIFQLQHDISTFHYDKNNIHFDFRRKTRVALEIELFQHQKVDPVLLRLSGQWTILNCFIWVW